MKQWRLLATVLVLAQLCLAADQEDRFTKSIQAAGAAYRSGNRTTAIHHLREALQLRPQDDYASEFLGTLYVLEGNLAAGLKYLNRAGRPKLLALRLPEDPEIEPGILRKLLPAPGSVLTNGDLRRAATEIERLETIHRYRFDLEPTSGDAFDLRFSYLNADRMSRGIVGTLLPFVRGLPFQTLYADWLNIQARAVNFRSLWRWDPDKRRAALSISGPIHSHPRWRLFLVTDLRDEIWDTGERPFQMRRNALSTGVSRTLNTRMLASLTLEHVQRRFADATFPGGTTLTQKTDLSIIAVDLPERGVSIRTHMTAELSRWFGIDTYSRLRASMEAAWSPAPKWRFEQRIFVGDTLGAAPFDELFLIGMERDHDLWYRGLSGTRHGRKGASPLLRRYFLSQSESQYRVYRHPAFSIHTAPFIDTLSSGGRVATGVQLTMATLSGIRVHFIAGRDLKSHSTATYFAVEPR